MQMLFNSKDIEEQAAFFTALSDTTRLKLFKLLSLQRTPDAVCVNALAGSLGVTQSAVSQHLKVLKSIGLVKGVRRGYHIHYFVNNDILEKYRNLTSAALSIEALSENQACQEYCPKRREENVSSG